MKRKINVHKIPPPKDYDPSLFVFFLLYVYLRYLALEHKPWERSTSKMIYPDFLLPHNSDLSIVDSSRDFLLNPMRNFSGFNVGQLT